MTLLIRETTFITAAQLPPGPIQPYGTGPTGGLVWVRVWDVNTTVKAPHHPWGYYWDQGNYILMPNGYWYTYRWVLMVIEVDH
ncbi:MAG: hypothetical protein QXL17_04030 [Candidatus Thermoplasmatota archaeon]